MATCTSTIRESLAWVALFIWVESDENEHGYGFGFGFGFGGFKDHGLATPVYSAF